MQKYTFSKHLTNHPITWSFIFAIFYSGMVILSFWHHLGIFQYKFKYIIYLFSIILLIVIFRLLLSSNRNLTTKIFALFFIIPLVCLGCFGLLSFPNLLFKEKFHNETYYLILEPELFDLHSFLHLYKCDYTTFDCHQTAYTQKDPSQSNFRLNFDPSTQEVNVLATALNDQKVLTYTYGKPSRYYDYPEIVNNKLYYLARTDDIENSPATYLIYVCNMDSTSCSKIPFQYTADGYFHEVLLQIDETSNEVKVVGNDADSTLIFTYGEHSRCYVDGCEIK